MCKIMIICQFGSQAVAHGPKGRVVHLAGVLTRQPPGRFIPHQVNFHVPPVKSSFVVKFVRVMDVFKRNASFTQFTSCCKSPHRIRWSPMYYIFAFLKLLMDWICQDISIMKFKVVVLATMTDKSVFDTLNIFVYPLINLVYYSVIYAQFEVSSLARTGNCMRD